MVPNNMIFFIGVVEDRNDPKSQGRVRVRIFGDHDADKTKIPTDSLPFSQVMMPVTSASCGGIGQSASWHIQRSEAATGGTQEYGYIGKYT